MACKFNKYSYSVGQYAFIAFGLVMGFVLIYLFVTEKGNLILILFISNT